MSLAPPEVTRRVTGAALWTYGGVFGDRLIRFVVFLIVARLVQPGQFGIVLLSLLAVEGVQALLNIGVPTTLLQQAEVSTPLLNTAFTINLVMSLLASAGLLLASGALARLAGAPAAAAMLRVLALTPVIGALGAVHVALLQRTLGFKALALRQTGASLVASGIAILMAFAGFGLWALVARAVALALTGSVAVWFASPYRPRLQFDPASARTSLASAWRLWAAGLATMANTRGSDVFAGLVLGATALGALRIAGQTVTLLVEMTIGPMTAVGFALLARARGQPEVFEQTLTNLARLSALLIFPAFAGLYVVGDELLPLMFGERWRPASALMPYMCAIGPALYFQLLISSALFAAQRSDRLLQWAVIEAAVTAATGMAGARFGLVGLAVAGTVRLYLMMPLGWLWLWRDVGVSAARLVAPAAPAVAAAGVMAAAVGLAKLGLAPLLAPAPLTTVLIAIGVLAYGAMMAIPARDLWRALAAQPSRDQAAMALMSKGEAAGHTPS
jgi:O-antigen/teichoic acid export membrane protein